MPKKNKKEIDLLKQIAKEESTDCFIDYNVEFDFHHFSKDVQMLFVKEHINSPNPVEFYMLKNLEKRIQKINSRYKVGILYTAKSDGEELNELR